MKTNEELAELIERTTPSLATLNERLPRIEISLRALIAGTVNNLAQQTSAYHDRYMAAMAAVEFVLTVSGMRPPWVDKNGVGWDPPADINSIILEVLGNLERQKKAAS